MNERTHAVRSFYFRTTQRPNIVYCQEGKLVIPWARRSIAGAGICPSCPHKTLRIPRPLRRITLVQCLRRLHTAPVLSGLGFRDWVRHSAVHCTVYWVCWLVDELYPQARVIRVGLDNLVTHKPATLYEAFSPPEARRSCKRLAFHYTPKHGSWLNMAEIELSVYGRTMKSNIRDIDTFTEEAHALMYDRNALGACVNWRFRTPDARTKLNRLYL